jgi:hypothetical protein
MSNPRHPHNWELLNNSDKAVYTQMHQALSAPTIRDRRKHSVDDFKEILEGIELFENIDDEDRWKRCLVCGIFRFPGGIAVNIQQLRSLIMKCKSSINCSLKRLGYTRIVCRADGCDPLFETIPFLKTHGTELRKWTIRYMDSEEGETAGVGSQTEVLADTGPESEDAGQWEMSCECEELLP